jgi:hypothetical protein
LGLKKVVTQNARYGPFRFHILKHGAELSANDPIFSAL